MKVKELIEKYKKLEGVWDAPGAETARQIFLQDLEQLDEPQKPVVPQFVADWYEEHKDNLEFYIFDYVYRFDQQKESDFKDWIDEFKNESLRILVNMHQFGYEVEEEKRYLVKVKGVCGNHETLNCEKHSKKWLFSDREENSLYKTKHTRKELEEAEFGWVFDCPGIEVEEVEE